MKVKLTILLAFLCLHAFGQKEVFFADTSVINRKIQTMQGVECSFTPNKLGNSLNYSFGDYFNFSGYIGYYYEKPIANTWSVIMTAGIHNVFYNKITISDAGQFTFNKAYRAILHIGAEPRWYYTFENRYDLGKTRLNSGWFLGCPLSLENLYGFHLNLTPSWGFRQSLTDRFFLEAEAGAGASLYLENLPNKPSFCYFLSAKFAYTF